MSFEEVIDAVDRAVVDCHSLAYSDQRDDGVSSEIMTWCGLEVSGGLTFAQYVADDGVRAEWSPSARSIVCHECRRQEEVATRVRRGP